MTTDYRAIACDQHSVLELMAMHRRPVEVEAVDESGAPSRLNGVVVDVLTHDRAEYLLLQISGIETVELRLDRLRRIREPDGPVLWRQESDNCD